jgi:hypothetical protein
LTVPIPTISQTTVREDGRPWPIPCGARWWKPGSIKPMSAASPRY